MHSEGRDHYRVLGIERTASNAEVKAAYRRLALRYHPDRNAGDKSAEERFKEVSLAYVVLGDEDRRMRYDRFGDRAEDAPFGDGAGSDWASAADFFEAVFGDLFGLGRKQVAGQDLRYTLEVEFEQAALGSEQAIRFQRAEDCRHCVGTGAEGGAAGLAACARCDGSGVMRQGTRWFKTRRECLACGGSGEVPRVRCAACGGAGLVEREREYVVCIPPGSQGGSSQRVPGAGSPGRRGGAAGDLFVVVRVRPHATYRAEDGILVCEVPITPTEAALGDEVDVPVLDGLVRMKIPAGTQSGAVFRIRGKGLPRASGGRGDAHVRVLVETPSSASGEARALLERLATALDDGAYPRRKAFREALKQP